LYVKQWAQSPAARGVKMAERSVLRAVALMVDAKVGFCYAPMAKIAEEALMPDERQARRSIALLERKGLVRRHVSVRSRDRSQTTNEYELPGMAGWDLRSGMRELDGVGTGGVAEGAERVDQASTVQSAGLVQESTAEARRRRQVFKIGRDRIAKDGPMQLPLERRRRPNPNLEGRGLGVEDGVDCPGGPGQQVSAPPGQQVSARDVVVDVVFEDIPTPTPIPGAGKVQKPLHDAKSREATAAATAAATTGAGEAAEAATGSRGRRSLSLARARVAGEAGRAREADGANGFEFGTGASRLETGSREELLELEATRVLMACGIAPDASTRRLRAAVVDALRLRCEQTRVRDEPGIVGEAGDLAVRRWNEYSAAAGARRLTYVVGVRKFFAGGVWLNPAVWPFERTHRA
jgi:hypothetical protein